MKCINERCQKEIGEAMYCPYCGTKQKKPKVYCICCGAEMDEDAIYCNNCGKKSFFVQQREQEEEARREAEAERDRLAQIDEQERLKKEKEAEEQKRKEREAEKEKKQALAREEYGDLMADLVPDLINHREKLEAHLYFVKKLARDSGWDEEAVVSAITDLLTMYSDFKQSHSIGVSFSGTEKKFLLYQAGMAHVDEAVLSKLL